MGIYLLVAGHAVVWEPEKGSSTTEVTPPEPKKELLKTATTDISKSSQYVQLVAPPEIPSGGRPTKYSNFVLPSESKDEQNTADNTVEVSEEDVLRWKNTFVDVLKPLRELDLDGDGRITGETESLWNILRHWIPTDENYPDPFMVEVLNSHPNDDVTIGQLYSKSHENCSVLSLTSASTRASGSNMVRGFQRYLSVFLPSNPSLYEPLFRSCNMFNNVLLLSDWQSLQGASLLRKIVPMSRITYVEARSNFNFKSELVGIEAMVSEIARNHVKGTSVFRLKLLSISRKCRKTWVAPESQWGRSVELKFTSETNEVEFVVTSKKQALSRKIPPMSFIPHINLETILALGVTEEQRVIFLGEQLATPRYPDPMVHNWIWSRGSVMRIDKVDLRYEKDVDESKTYWGQSTLGYVTLLGDNLCLPDIKSGLPEVMSTRCESCHCCVLTCSYAPLCPNSPPCVWDQPVCSSCLECKVCLAENNPRKSTIVQCPFQKYSSWGKATKLWKKWEKKAKESRSDELWRRTSC